MAGGVEFVAVGRITRAHGVRGEVAVLPLSQEEKRFEPGSRLLAGTDHLPLTVDSARGHRHRLLVTFAEVADRTRAEELAGHYLFVPASEVGPPPVGEFWPHQLVGCRVETERGTPLGTLREVVAGPVNDLWVARTEEGDEVLIPALKDVVRQVDLEHGRIVVAEIPGLTVPDEAEEAGETG